MKTSCKMANWGQGRLTRPCNPGPQEYKLWVVHVNWDREIQNKPKPDPML